MGANSRLGAYSNKYGKCLDNSDDCLVITDSV